MNPKKLTRIFFYTLFALTGGFAVAYFIATLVRLDALVPVVLAVAVSATVFGLFKLANWAFTPDRTPAHSDFPVPASKKGKTNA